MSELYERAGWVILSFIYLPLHGFETGGVSEMMSGLNELYEQLYGPAITVGCNLFHILAE